MSGPVDGELLAKLQKILALIVSYVGAEIRATSK
jgi:hypothetical protein